MEKLWPSHRNSPHGGIVTLWASVVEWFSELCARLHFGIHLISNEPQLLSQFSNFLEIYVHWGTHESHRGRNTSFAAPTSVIRFRGIIGIAWIQLIAILCWSTFRDVLVVRWTPKEDKTSFPHLHILPSESNPSCCCISFGKQPANVIESYERLRIF